ncbi:S24 family peptidase [Salipiger sp. IMCC34102]|uniref:S24 family peptidase n=1 Tax=Salipiger sp. IMCC34102 TaxID=2510647 RepID=UPI00101DCB44|nr:S24 family peptidase [Salipiger sp. IMCC34102]RYH02824.1 S24 family peptidase [Salipiger sp. IMCC34102]
MRVSPLIRDGDLILLNQHRGDLVSGEVYGLVDTEGDVRVKRLAKIEGGLLLQSDNTDHPPETRSGEDANRIRIIGRYAWSGHSHSPIIARRPKRSTFQHDWI